MKTWKPTLPPFRKFKKEVFKHASDTGQFIFQIGECEALRKPSKEVPVNKITSNEYKAKFKYLKNCMKKYRKLTGYGRGITAVQVGIPERFSVVYQPSIKSLTSSAYKPEKTFILINPKITKKSAKKLIYSEMCMSANPIIAPTIRPAWIEFKYLDENGKKQIWDTKDNTDNGRMMNRVFQHEIDHMEGIINIDKVKSSDLILESDPKYYENAKFILVK